MDSKAFQDGFLPAIVASLISAQLLTGCSKPSPAPQTTLGHSEKPPTLSSEPPTQVRIKPWVEAKELLEVYATDYSAPRESKGLGVVELSGGTVVLHVMSYLDSYKNREQPDERKEREIRTYHLLEWFPRIPESEAKELRPKDSIERVEFSVKRLCIFELFSGGELLVRTGQTAKWETPSTQRSESIIHDYGWAAGLPRKLQGEYVIVAQNQINSGVQPNVGFGSASSSGYSMHVASRPLNVSSELPQQIVDIDYFGGVQIAASVECLPLPNPIATTELVEKAKSWAAESTGDPKNTKSRYYFAWTALFLQDRFSLPQQERKDFLHQAAQRIKEACELEPKNPALAELRRRIAISEISAADDEAEVLQHARRLLELRPAFENCTVAGRSLLHRYRPRPSDAVIDVIGRLIDRSLLISSTWDWQLERDIRGWRAQLREINAPALSDILIRYEKQLQDRSK